MMSPVSPRADFRFMVHERNVRAKAFNEFLGRLMVGATQSVFVILDGHPIHSAKLVRDTSPRSRAASSSSTFHPYSPQLNPDEQAWVHVKSQNRCKFAQNGNDMKKLAVAALRRIQNYPNSSNCSSITSIVNTLRTELIF
jgi:hypothetical protein